MVNAQAVRRKLSKQLRIDLDPWEKVHIYTGSSGESNNNQAPDVSNEEFLTNSEALQKVLEESMTEDIDTPCKVEIRELGTYLARISLRGGYKVPLKFEVVKR